MVSSACGRPQPSPSSASSCMYSVPGACSYPYPAMDTLDTCQYYARLQTTTTPGLPPVKGPSGGKAAGAGAGTGTGSGGGGGGKGRSSSYKHIPHRDKPPHLVQRRNARERRRVQAVNSAFSRLRRHIPMENRNKRLSKVKTLKIAMDYIDHLRELITTYDAQVMQQQQQHGVSTWQQQQAYVAPRDSTTAYYSAPQMYTPNV